MDGWNRGSSREKGWKLCDVVVSALWAATMLVCWFIGLYGHCHGDKSGVLPIAMA